MQVTKNNTLGGEGRDPLVDPQGRTEKGSGLTAEEIALRGRKTGETQGISVEEETIFWGVLEGLNFGG